VELLIVVTLWAVGAGVGLGLARLVLAGIVAITFRR
jgi:hypothetical protein